MRLNQAIAKSGKWSRRKADELIASGKVAVNGSIVKDFHYKLDLSKDKLQVEGQTIAVKAIEYIVMNKPKGVITTCSDQYGRKNILDLLPERLRHLRPVGRLDRNSEGLILLTNDGQFTQKIAHPSLHMEKTYEVSVKGKVSKKDLDQLRRGILLEDGMTLPAKVNLIQFQEDRSKLRIVLKEGRNRQIRRMLAKLDYEVVKLVRVAIGELKLGQLPPGAWRFLSQDEIRSFEIR